MVAPLAAEMVDLEQLKRVSAYIESDASKQRVGTATVLTVRGRRGELAFFMSLI